MNHPSILTGKRLKVAAFVIIALLISFSQIITSFLSNGGDIRNLSESRFIDFMEEEIPNQMKKYSIPGVSLLIIKNREPLWGKAYGYADIEHNRKMTRDAIFRVESISKPVTAWGVMKLAERGLIRLDDPVQQYLSSWTLPESKYNLSGITIRRLLSNSAGMPQGTLGEEYPPYNEKPSLRQYLTKEAYLTDIPGSNFQYSNPGFNLLELLIEEVTGRDFNEYMEYDILMPLGMQHSSFNWIDDRSSRIPMGYDLQGNPVPPYVYPYKASGGLFATVEDIARFAIAEMAIATNVEHTVLSEESIKHILTPQINTSGIYGFVADGYGFGHFIETLPDGKKAIWHGGQGHGWMTHFHAVPETGDGIVILTNSQRSWPFIASVLNDWSRWRDFGPVKFGRITMVVTGLRIIIGLILLIAIWRMVQVVYGIINGSRKPAILKSPVLGVRIVEFSVGMAILGIFLWAISKDYLFLTSIFPVEAIWLGWALLFLSLILLISAMLPVGRKGKDSKINHQLL